MGNKIEIQNFNDDIIEEIGKSLAKAMKLKRNDFHIDNKICDRLHFYNKHTFCNPFDKDCEVAAFCFSAVNEKYEVFYCTFMVRADGSISLINTPRGNEYIIRNAIGHIDFQRDYVKIIDKLNALKPNQKDYTGLKSEIRGMTSSFYLADQF